MQAHWQRKSSVTDTCRGVERRHGAHMLHIVLLILYYVDSESETVTSFLFIARPRHKHLIVKMIVVLTISENFPFHLRRSLNPYPISAYKPRKMN